MRAIVFVALLLCEIRPGHADPVPLPPAPARPDAAAGPTKVEVGGWLADILRLNNRVEAARALDRHSRWVFPLVFLVASALLTTF